MIDNHKLSGFIERVEGDFRPITADVFLTDYCNNKCSYCRFSHESGKYMSFSEFVKVSERLLELGVKGIILTGGGEPTINPDFEKICRWLKENKIAFGVNTNFNRLIVTEPKFLKVSLDEGNAEDYKKWRGVDAYRKVLTNIEQYAAAHPAVRVGVQCVTRTKEQVRAFYDAVKDLGVWYIQFRPIEICGKHIDYTDIISEIDKIAEKDKRIIKSYKFDFVDWEVEKCWANWAAITVQADGRVLYCCHRPDDVVGSIFDEDILKKLQEYFPDMSKCEIPCRLTGANWYVYNYLNDGDRYFV